jgi:hypothetical protein
MVSDLVGGSPLQRLHLVGGSELGSSDASNPPSPHADTPSSDWEPWSSTARPGPPPPPSFIRHNKEEADWDDWLIDFTARLVASEDWLINFAAQFQFFEILSRFYFAEFSWSVQSKFSWILVSRDLVFYIFFCLKNSHFFWNFKLKPIGEPTKPDQISFIGFRENQPVFVDI